MKQDETGLGLVEIVIAMFLLALLAVAFLPLLVASLEASVRNEAAIRANNLLASQLDSVGSTERTCQGLQAWASSPPPPVFDDRDAEYRVVRSVAGCPSADFPGLATVTLTVRVLVNPTIEVRAVTQVVVEESAP